MTPSPVRMLDPCSFKLPLAAKSVTVLLFCCLRPSYAIVDARGGDVSWIKIRLRRYGRRGKTFRTTLTNGRIAGGVALHVSEPTRPSLLLLIELIFCLGSVWAKLELAFLASVIDYSMISMRFPLQIHAYPRRFCRSRMDQMNHTCTVM